MSVLTPGRSSTTNEQPGSGRSDVRLVTWFFPAWYGAFGVIICIMARVTPPPRPDVSAQDKVSFFVSNGLTIQIGFTVLLILLGGAAVTNVLVAYQL